jgi:class 3 adenylate cyclase
VITALLALALAAAVVTIVIRARRERAARAAVERRLGDAAHELEALQYAFSRFAPATVVDDIIARGVSTRSEKKDVTILFADLKGFTPLAERLDPGVLVDILNGWFDRMARAIQAHRGHLSKLIGDGLLAVFGALESNPWQANDAAHASLAMRRALADYNRALRAQGRPELAMGIGIHRGVVVAGVLGATTLVEYGVVGDAVNVAARIEALTRVHDVDVLVTAAVHDALDRRFQVRAMPPAELKGVALPVATFAVDGFDDAAVASTREAEVVPLHRRDD